MKWAKQKLALKAPEIEKTEESEDAKKEGAKDDVVEMKEEETEDAKKGLNIHWKEKPRPWMSRKTTMIRVTP